jgi:ABC-type branched-subunit amino acid transport system substrate-binding protein
MRGVAPVRTRAFTLCACLALGALAGCTAQTNSAVIVSGATLTIYASQPPAGAGGQAATDVLDAEQLAFAQTGATLGKLKLRFRTLSGTELSANARTAIQDKTAIAYLGEIVPGTSPVSVQITNELGLLEVSPTDTAGYLTQATPAVPGAPSQYYPSSSTYHQTFARVVPNTAQEAKALVSEMHSVGVSKLSVASDGSPYGASIALEVRQDAASAGLSIVSGAATADAVFYGAGAGAAATKALDQAAVTNSSAKLFGPSGLYDDSFVAGLSAAAQKQLYVSSPGFLAKDLTPTGQQFAAAFAARYGHDPVPEAIFGYEAVIALRHVLTEVGALATNRADVVIAFRTIKNLSSPLGTFSISGGDTSIAPFVIARPQGGKLVPRTAG